MPVVWEKGWTHPVDWTEDFVEQDGRYLGKQREVVHGVQDCPSVEYMFFEAGRDQRM